MTQVMLKQVTQEEVLDFVFPRYPSLLSTFRQKLVLYKHSVKNNNGTLSQTQYLVAKGLLLPFEYSLTDLQAINENKDHGVGQFKKEVLYSGAKQSFRNGREVNIFTQKKSDGRQVLISRVEDLSKWLVATNAGTVLFSGEEDLRKLKHNPKVSK